jgi:hypothetical protein
VVRAGRHPGGDGGGRVRRGRPAATP